MATSFGLGLEAQARAVGAGDPRRRSSAKLTGVDLGRGSPATQTARSLPWGGSLMPADEVPGEG